MTDARLAGAALEVAYTSTSPERRLTGVALEVAASRYVLAAGQVTVTAAVTGDVPTTSKRGWGILR